MGRKHHTVEQIIRKLREVEVELAQGSKTPQVCRKLEISEQTYYRWRKEYGAHGSTATCSCCLPGVIVSRASKGPQARALGAQCAASQRLNLTVEAWRRHNPASPPEPHNPPRDLLEARQLHLVLHIPVLELLHFLTCVMPRVQNQRCQGLVELEDDLVVFFA